jgi:hypothetical protein
MVRYAQRQNPLKVATLVETTKLDALYSYKGFKAYLPMRCTQTGQPFNTWWAEQGLVLHTEFRDGNVPAGYKQLRVLKEALAMLPAGVEKVRLRPVCVQRTGRQELSRLSVPGDP